MGQACDVLQDPGLVTTTEHGHLMFGELSACGANLQEIMARREEGTPCEERRIGELVWGGCSAASKRDASFDSPRLRCSAATALPDC